MAEDHELVRLLGDGDRDALQEIYVKYRDDLLRIAACMTGSWLEAEDCLHDVFVRLALNSARLHIDENLKGYLVTAVANRSRDRLRLKKRNRTSGDAVPESDGDLAVHRTDPASELVEAEANEQLYRAIAALPTEQRTVVTLRLHGGMTFEEIAQQEGVSDNTVRSRYRYALDRLRKSLRVGVK